MTNQAKVTMNDKSQPTQSRPAPTAQLTLASPRRLQRQNADANEALQQSLDRRW